MKKEKELKNNKEWVKSNSLQQSTVVIHTAASNRRLDLQLEKISYAYFHKILYAYISKYV